MTIQEYLAERKGSVLATWFALTVQTYPRETVEYLAKQDAPASTPAGRTIMELLDRLITGLQEGRQPADLAVLLEDTIKAKAAADMEPDRALKFIFMLKEAIRRELASSPMDEQLLSECLAFEFRIDDLALLAFSIYMSDREELYRLKAEEIRNTTAKVLLEANITGRIAETKPGDDE